MSRTFHRGQRRVRVEGVRRQPADLRKLARALLALAAAEAERDAEAEHAARAGGQRPSPRRRGAA